MFMITLALITAYSSDGLAKEYPIRGLQPYFHVQCKSGRGVALLSESPADPSSARKRRLIDADISGYGAQTAFRFLLSRDKVDYGSDASGAVWVSARGKRVTIGKVADLAAQCFAHNGDRLISRYVPVQLDPSIDARASSVIVGSCQSRSNYPDSGRTFWRDTEERIVFTDKQTGVSVGIVQKSNYVFSSEPECRHGDLP